MLTGLVTIALMGMPANAARPTAKTQKATRPSEAASGATDSLRKKAQSIFQQALARFFDDKDISRARAGFLESMRTDPSYPLPRFNLGVLAEADENWDEAIRWFQEFVQLDGASDYAKRAQKELARLRQLQTLEKSDQGRQRRLYDETIGRAKILLDARFLKEAIAEAASAAKIDDTRWEAYAVAGSALSERGAFDQAANFLQRAIDRAPQDKKGKLAQALAQCEQRKSPKD
jgi:tetratricopeptide (TPR) repeat protein